MKKIAKISAIVTVVVVILAITVVILAKVLITPERVKQAVLPFAEKSLQREIELGDIEVSIFSGVELNGLKIYEADRQETFVSAEQVQLRYQLLPLLAMRVVIDEVRLVRPTVRVVRLADGSFNYSDMLVPADEEKQSAKPVSASKTAGTQSPVSLLVSQVRLQGGEILFLDHVLNDKAPYRYDIKDLNVEAKGITLTGSIPVKVQGTLNGGSFSLDGKVDVNQPGGEFSLKVQDLDALAFKPYFEDKLPGQLGRLKLGLTSKMTGSLKEVSVSGQVLLSELDFVLQNFPDVPIHQARLQVDHDLQLDLEKGRLDINQLKADFNGIKAEAHGTLSSLFEEPAAELELIVPGLNLREAMLNMPEGVVKEARELDPAGIVKVQAGLSGSFSSPLKMLKTASVELDNVQATIAGYRPSLDGQLKLAGDQLQSETLHLRMGDNEAEIDFAARNIYGKPVAVTADLNSKRFLLEPLLKGAAGSAAASGQDRSTAQPPSSPVKQKSAGPDMGPGPFDLPLRASGRITIGETVYKGLSIQDFVAHYQLRDNVLTVDRMDGKVAGGTFNNNARIDLGQKGLAYSGRITLNAVQADPLLSAFLPASQGSIYGGMDLDLTLAARGTQWEAIRRQLTGQGNVELSNGRIASPGLVSGFASVLDLGATDSISFNSFRSAIKIAQGKVQLDSRLLGDQFKLNPKGTIGLDGGLDLALDTRLHPEVADRLDQKGQVTRYLQDQDGWSQLPLLVTGTFADPRFGLDANALKSQASKAIGKEIERQVDKLFKQEDQENAAPGEAKAEDPAQKAIKESLKKLFGN